MMLETRSEEKPRHLGEIFNELKERGDRIADGPSLKYPIEGPITAPRLRLFSTLPYETSIDGHPGKLILATGTKYSTSHDESSGRVEQLINSQVSFHMHPFVENGIALSAPSFADIMVDSRRHAASPPRPPSILGHTEGLLVYRCPGDVKMGALIDWKDRRDALVKSSARTGVIDWKALAALDRVVAERLGLIQDEARWSEEKKMENILAMFR
jgi:hypothetical protein